MLTVVLVRHGESTANVDRIFANRPEIPGDLTPVGFAQAEALARSLDHYGPTHLYTSPLPRALQTAGIIARRTGLPVRIDNRLREYDVGEDEGHPYTGPDAWRQKRYEAVQRAWRNGDRAARHPGGESLDDIVRRFLGFVNELPSRHADRDVVVAVTHGGLIHAAMPALFPLSPPDLPIRAPLGHTGLAVGVLRDGIWHCTRWESSGAPDERE